MQSAIQPSAERYFIFFYVAVFALYERKNRNTDKKGSTILELRQVLGLGQQQLIEQLRRGVEVAHQRVVDKRLERQLAVACQRSVDDQLLVEHMQMHSAQHARRQRAHTDTIRAVRPDHAHGLDYRLAR